MIPSWSQIKLYALIGLVFVTFTLGVQVTRNHYAAKEARAKIAELEKAVELRDRLSGILRNHAEEQERTATANAERIKQYEAYLRARPDNCNLNSDDLRWMQPLRRPGTAPAR